MRIVPHFLEEFNDNLGNVVESEQQTPMFERSPKEVIRINGFTGGQQTSLSGMQHNFSEEDLEQVVKSYNPGVHIAPLIRGHDEKDDGAPSSGWVKNVIRKGLDLFFDVALTGFGKTILEEGNYRRVSCRFYPPNDPSNPTPGQLSLRHLALVTIPAVKGLASFSEQDIAGIDEWEFMYGEKISSIPLEKIQINLDNALKQRPELLEQLFLDGDEDDQEYDSPDLENIDLSESTNDKDEDEDKRYQDDVYRFPFEEESKQEKNQRQEQEKEELHDIEVKSKSYKTAITSTLPTVVKDNSEDEEEDYELDNNTPKSRSNKSKDKNKKLTHSFDLDSNSSYDFSDTEEPPPLIEQEEEIDSLQSPEEVKNTVDPVDNSSTPNKNTELKTKVKIPPVKKPENRSILSKNNNNNNSFSEKITANSSDYWNKYIQKFYTEGILLESIISTEQLAQSLNKLDEVQQQLSFSENEVNPLKTIVELLENLPPLVGLNGFERSPDTSYQNLFKDTLVETSGNSLVFGENNETYDSSSFNLHQQAVLFSEKNGTDYYSSVRKLIEKQS